MFLPHVSLNKAVFSVSRACTRSKLMCTGIPAVSTQDFYTYFKYCKFLYFRKMHIKFQGFINNTISYLTPPFELQAQGKAFKH